ncbi:Uncharacterised protein [BD1-7 clade bacterium]|uniref:YchJ-like middle NTF2-like domain-containing protein n=1 Tax=BD1-7 clade bacterium TaxID=2029982 RepID=A0A5S9QK16_9GAMM|nr:Uncharacterised protein [BD1-7 clade bacterium]
MTQSTDQIPCPCHSGQHYPACCGQYHNHSAIPQTAEALMRSRYSAYALGYQMPETCADYLLETSNTPSSERMSLIEYMKQHRWIGLVIIDTSAINADSENAMVEFCALSTPATSYNNQNTNQQLPNQQHERSQFIRRDGRWIYSNGEALKDISFERNALCWCGSGKKYKKCHAL